MLSGVVLLAGVCLTTSVRADQDRIAGQVMQNGSKPFVDTVRQMVNRDDQVRRDVLAGLRPASDPAAGVTRYRWRSKSDQPDGNVFLPASRSAGGGGLSKLGSGGDAPQVMGTNFAGIGQQDQIDDFGSGSFPPDTMGAVGPNHFVTMLRGSVAIFDKIGTRLSHVTLNSFFTTGSYPRGAAYSPRVLFDRRSGRWFACALETNGGAANHVILAVSASNNPTGTWAKYVIALGQAGVLTDEAMLGTDDNGVYFGAAMVPSAGAAFGKITATRKASLLAATPSLGTVYHWTNITDMFATPVPTHNQAAAAASDYAFFLSSSTTVYANVRYRHLQWSALLVPTLSLTAEIVTSAYGANPDAPALGSATSIDTGDDRLLMAIQRANGLWTCRTVGVTATGGTGVIDRSACEWIRFDVTAPGTPVLSQLGRVYDGAASNPRFYFYPSIMVSGQGHAAMAFSGSSVAEYVGAYTCGRLATDAVNTMQAVSQIKAGEADYEQLLGGRNRWGNYSFTSLDPNDDMSLWTIQEYAASTIANPTNIWGTWIARLLAPPPTITSATGSAVQGVANVVVNITGTQFFDPGAGYANRPDVTVSGDGISNKVVTYNSTTSMAVRFDVSLDATIGARDLSVVNPDGQTATAVGAFTVLRAIPTTVTVGDNSGQIGATVPLTAVLTNDDTSAGIAGKTLTFKVDGTTVGTGVTDATGTATYSYLIPEAAGIGTRTIRAEFAFDGIHRPSAGEATLTVLQTPTRLFVVNRTGTIGASVQLQAGLTRTTDNGPIQGRTVAFQVSGTAVGSAVTAADGYAKLNWVIVEGPGAGTRPIAGDFAGDASYLASAHSGTLTVNKANTTIYGLDRTGVNGALIELKALLRRSTDLTPLPVRTLDFSVDGTPVGSGVTDGTGWAKTNYTIATTPGQFPIGYAFAGDAGHNPGTGTSTLTVTDTTSLDVDDAAGQVGETVSLKATLTRSFDGNPVTGKSVAFTVGGTAAGSGTTDAMGIATTDYVIPVGGGTGDRVIGASFAGDAVYAASSGTDTLTISPADTTTTVADVAGMLHETVDLTATVTRNSDNGPVVAMDCDFDVDGTLVGFGLTDAAGVATLPYVIPEGAGPGDRVILVYAIGDAEHNPSDGTGTLSTEKANTALTVNSPTGTAGQSVDITGTLTVNPPIPGRDIEIKVDGTSVGTATTDAAGDFTLSYAIPALIAVGDYPIAAEFAGDAYYLASSANGTLTVKSDTTVGVYAVQGTPGSVVELAAQLIASSTGSPLEGRSIEFAADGTSVGSGTTDGAGVAKVNYTIPWGVATQTIGAAFAGEALYNASSGTGTLTVIKLNTITTALNRSGTGSETVALFGLLRRATDNAVLPGKTVSFKIDGTLVGSGVTQANGWAQFNWKINAGPASRTITAEFAGDVNYNPSSGNATLTVTTWTTKMVGANRTGKISSYTVLRAWLYRSDNAPLPGKSISFSVDGTLVGSATTQIRDGLADAQVGYIIPEGAGAGVRSILADWAGDAGYGPVSKTNTLTAQKTTPYIWVMPRSCKVGHPVSLYAYFRRLPDYQKQAGKPVDFKLDGTLIHSMNTDGNGVAQFIYQTTQPIGSYTIRCEYAGDAWTEAGFGQGALTIVP